MLILEKFAGTKFWTLYRRAASIACNGDNQYQVEALRRLLSWAGQHVPLWQTRLGGREIPRVESELVDFWQTLPLTTKHEIKSLPLEELTSANTRSQWRFGNSGGTIDRVSIVSDFNKRDHIRASNLRLVNALLGQPLGARIVEIPPDACSVVCGLRDEGPVELWPFVGWAWRNGLLFKRETRPDLRGRIERHWIVQQETLEPISSCAATEMLPQLDAHLDRIVACQPQILRGLPHFLLWLADRAAERRLKFPGLQAVLPYGGLMCQAMAQRVARGWGVPFRDYYGTSEVGAIALQDSPASPECAAQGMRIFADQVLVEIVDEENRPVGANQIGRILLTDLHNQAMPLVRYDVGDYGRWLVPDQATKLHNTFDFNRQTRLEVVGRGAEMIRRADGQWIGPRELMNIIYDDDSLLNACLNCPADLSTSARSRISLDYVSHALLDASRLALLGERLEYSGTITARRTNSLRPEGSGKFRFVRTTTAPTKELGVT